MKKIFALLIIFIGLNAFSYGQTKNDDILRLLRMSGTVELANQTMDAMIPQYQQIIPGIPEEFWLRFKERLNIEALLLACIPSYDRHFSHEEIRQLISFYESPIGRRLVEVSPFLNQETMVIGQRWGEQLGQEIVMELIKEGFLNN